MLGTEGRVYDIHVTQSSPLRHPVLCSLLSAAAAGRRLARGRSAARPGTGRDASRALLPRAVGWYRFKIMIVLAHDMFENDITQ